MANVAPYKMLGYSIKRARQQFDPPLSERSLRRAINDGRIKTIILGKRKYILSSELEKVTAIPGTIT